MPAREFEPAACLDDLLLLNAHDIEQGYYYGLAGNPEPAHHFVGRSFLHGYRNALVDRGEAERDAAQQALIKDYAFRVVDLPQIYPQ